MNIVKTITLVLVAAVSVTAGGARAESGFPQLRPHTAQVPILRPLRDPSVRRFRPLRDPSAFLRLRPLKEPAPCAGTGDTSCPLVDAPRINKRRSTIPGTLRPDYGRPPVMTLQPPRSGYASKYRSFGGNRGITGGY